MPSPPFRHDRFMPPLDCPLQVSCLPPSCLPPQTQSASPTRTYRTFDCQGIVSPTLHALLLPSFSSRTAPAPNSWRVPLLRQRTLPRRNPRLLRSLPPNDRLPNLHSRPQRAAALPLWPRLPTLNPPTHHNPPLAPSEPTCDTDVGLEPDSPIPLDPPADSFIGHLADGPVRERFSQ